MIKRTTFEIPIWFWETAKYIGDIRNANNTENMKANPDEYDRGKRNEYVNQIGIIGELILRQKYGDVEGCKIAPWDDRSFVGDMIHGGKRYDIKTTETNVAMVNKRAFEKHNVDFYIFAFIKQKRFVELLLVPKTIVEKFPIIETKSPYYGEKKENIK